MFPVLRTWRAKSDYIILFRYALMGSGGFWFRDCVLQGPQIARIDFLDIEDSLLNELKHYIPMLSIKLDILHSVIASVYYR